MMDIYEKNLHIDDETFEAMRHDADRILQSLLKNMVEKDSYEGSLTIKIDVLLQKETIQNNSEEIEGETRDVLIPAFSHKIGSVMQIKDDAKGSVNYEGMEIVWDENKGEYVVRPIADTYQRSIFDADFREADAEDEQQSFTDQLIEDMSGTFIDEDYPYGKTED